VSQTETSTELAVPAPQSTAIATSPILRPVVRVDEMVQHHKEMAAFVQGALELNRDFGVIPGTGDKPTLLKPGAERLLIGFGCEAEPEIVEKETDHNHKNVFINKKWEATDPPKLENGRQDDDAIKAMKAAGTHRFKKVNNGWQFQQAEIESGESLGLYRYVIRVTIRHRATGEVVGHGIGSCSSLESKYIRSPRDAENTILKMAKKRALVDAVLTTFGLSDRFTQDVEEIAENQTARTGKTHEQPTNTAEVAKAVASPETRAAGKWIKDIGMNKKQFEAFQDLCGSRNVTWHLIAGEAKEAGVANESELLAYMDGEFPGGGEEFGGTETEEIIDAVATDVYTGPTVKPDPYADEAEPALAEAK
jgi:hypothetical protein